MIGCLLLCWFGVCLGVWVALVSLCFYFPFYLCWVDCFWFGLLFCLLIGWYLPPVDLVLFI